MKTILVEISEFERDAIAAAVAQYSAACDRLASDMKTAGFKGPNGEIPTRHDIDRIVARSTACTDVLKRLHLASTIPGAQQ